MESEKLLTCCAPRAPINSTSSASGTMKCLRVDLKNHRVNLSECPIPKISDDNEDNVVVEVVLSGLCGTDLHIVEGKFPSDDAVVLGHEFVGYVYEVAKNERVFKVRDRVAIMPNFNCGVCELCRRGKSNFCKVGGIRHTVGIWKNGGFSKYCKVHTSLVYKLNDNLHFDQAIFAEPLSCILHAFDVMPHPQVGWKILIIGAGIIGLLWSCLLHHLGHRDVILVESSPARRESFKKLELGFRMLEWDQILQCENHCKDWSAFDMVVDCSGNPEAVAQAFPMLQDKGVLTLFGVADPAKKMTISPFEMYMKELTIVGVMIQTNICFQRALDVLLAMGPRYINEQHLNTKTYKLENYEQALKDLHDLMYSKVIFDLS